MHLSVWKTGLAIGAGAGLWHLAWAALAAFGAAEMVSDIAAGSQTVSANLEFRPFDAIVALALAVATAVLGFAIGIVLAILLNGAHGGAAR